MKAKKSPTLFTIGHSTRSLGEFVELLKLNGIELLVDVRTVPKSRTNPQFNKDTLGNDLDKEGIEYFHMTDLGGLRHAKKDSKNIVWENASFRGYADYMETDEFRNAIEELLKLAKKKKLAVMCSEAVWWRCHRSMIADELVAEGYEVRHIMGDKEPGEHKLRSFAHVKRGHVSYR